MIPLRINLVLSCQGTSLSYTPGIDFYPVHGGIDFYPIPPGQMYKFQLILQESKDSFQQKTFWNMCNGHAGIVIAKAARTINPKQQNCETIQDIFFNFLIVIFLPLKKSKRSGEGYEFNEYPDPFSDVNQA
ncbi:hypothetical protein Glove_326g6 [Diversispora epigaea]|uniref:Uncharacterized protein n=1 Tax=Diversispora epigaea TaxID=1348612 RepID=A0A397HMH5_9GLOM|nr:hypothetical protein Glove_326g6 [Diversispora epigaea]